jgi:hypothetical protein
VFCGRWEFHRLAFSRNVKLTAKILVRRLILRYKNARHFSPKYPAWSPPRTSSISLHPPRSTLEWNGIAALAAAIFLCYLGYGAEHLTPPRPSTQYPDPANYLALSTPRRYSLVIFEAPQFSSFSALISSRARGVSSMSARAKVEALNAKTLGGPPNTSRFMPPTPHSTIS